MWMFFWQEISGEKYLRFNNHCIDWMRLIRLNLSKHFTLHGFLMCKIHFLAGQEMIMIVQLLSQQIFVNSRVLISKNLTCFYWNIGISNESCQMATWSDAQSLNVCSWLTSFLRSKLCWFCSIKSPYDFPVFFFFLYIVVYQMSVL